jgi:outer membrane protein OmpA-like peptidoglycan-associated protein/tetratricopeptide (TPR) repeat protein
MAQDNYKKFLKLADRYYNAEQYDDAAHFYLKADSIKPFSGVSANNLAYSLFYIPERELEAIPYFEKALDSRKNNIQLIHKDLGTLYHKVFQFEKAIKHFSTYLNNAGRDDRFIIYCERMLETCNNARKIVSAKKNYDLTPLPYPLSKHNTQQAYTTVDGQLLIFQDQDNNIHKSAISVDKVEPSINLFIDDSFKDAKLVGISHDAQIIYLRKQNRGNFDLFEGYLEGLTIKRIRALDSEINSKFNEYDLSLSADGTTLYFSSDRPGGYGKSDIYKVYKTKNNRWSDPENMGPEINTPYDEVSPYIHASGKYLYFASQGHENMGGFDIFKVTNKVGTWNKPENVVYINTIYDDISFSQTGNGNLVVFSRPKDFTPEEKHLWSVNLSENIPITLVKGTIKAGSPPQPVSAKIRVYERHSKERMKYIYSPNPQTGRYLLIFPPGKNYDMVVEANGFLPQLINIDVPNQTYFYELFQEIRLYDISVANEKIGEKIEVENVFYDIYRTHLADSLSSKYSPDPSKNYDHLLQMVEDIINTTDSIGIEEISDIREKPKTDNAAQQESYDHLINLIETAIATTDSVSLALIDEQTVSNEKTSDVYFYAPEDTNVTSLDKIVYNADTLYTKPELSTNKEKQAAAQNKTYDFNYRRLSEEQKRTIIVNTIYFDVNEVHVKPQYLFDLSQITDLVYDNTSLGIEIHGYADEKGNEKYNEQLSERRANEVFKQVQSNRLKSNRIIIEGRGEIKSGNMNARNLAESRRVDIIIFEPILKEDFEK